MERSRAPRLKLFARRTSFQVLSLTVFGFSCADQSSEVSCQNALDSAGIHIVSNNCDPADFPRWRTEQELVIGELDGPPEFTFGRVADVEVDRNGRIYVLDGLAQTVRIFDSDGSFVRTIGRPGDGPGEFGAYPVAIRVGPNDSIYVPDNRPSRMHVFGPDGNSPRTFRIPVARMPGPFDLRVLRDGDLLIRWYTFSTAPDGRFYPWDVLLESRPPYVSFDTVLTFIYEPPDLGELAQILQPMIVNSAIFDVLNDDRILWSAFEDHQLYVTGLSGGRRGLIRNTAWQRRSVSDAERSVLTRKYLASRESRSTPQTSLPSFVRFPDSLPSFVALRSAPDGGFWVQATDEVANMDPDGLGDAVRTYLLGRNSWQVYDSTGFFRATVETPQDFRITRVLADAVVGVHKDDLGVERIMRLRIVR